MQKILIVDDTPASIKILLEALKDLNYEILVATSGAIALTIASSENPDLILLDIMMPEMDGYEVCTKLKANTATKNIPVIFITLRGDEACEAKGLERGAVDYIIKPIHPAIVQTRVKTHLELKLAYEELAKKNVALKKTAILRDDVEHILRHDLKTPLNGIINYSMILLEAFEQNPQQKHFLSDIESLGYEMLDMINRSLDLYKMETGTYSYQPKNVDILPIIQKIVTETENLSASKTLSVDILNHSRPPAETFIVQGERLLCYSMLANLLKNALEASPKGTHITVSLEDEKDKALIKIHNQGAVPTEIRDKFFDKHTTIGKSGGTGLGTYSAKLMAETQGGNIQLETSAKTGTTVMVQLRLKSKNLR
jgi:DNA-binding response OmpR family regulator